MGLKAVLSQADFEALPEATRGFYQAGAQAGTFVLQIEGQHPEVAVANARLSEFRDNNVRLMRENETLGRLKTAHETELSELRQKVAAPPAGQPPAGQPPAGQPPAGQPAPTGTISQDELRRAIEAATKPLVDKIAAKEQTEAQTAARLATVELEREISDVALTLGVRKTAIEDVIDRAKKYGFVRRDDRTVAVDGESIRYSAFRGGEPLDIKEWMTGLTKTAEHLFMPSSGGGAAQQNTVRALPDGSVLVNPTPMELSKNAEAIASGKVRVERR